MNDLNKNIIKDQTFEFYHNNSINSKSKKIANIFFDLIINYFNDKNVTGVKIFKIFTIGLIHYNEQKTYGILAGIFNLHLQFNINKLNIYRIVMLKIFSLGAIQNDDKNALGILITILGININLMIGINKTDIGSEKKKIRNNTIIGEA